MTSFSSYSVPIADCGGQGLVHQVYDAKLYRYDADQSLQAVCGAIILPAPMSSPIGKTCQECETRIGYLTWDCLPLPQATLRRLLPHPFRLQGG
jgi:hypothetical protein